MALSTLLLMSITDIAVFGMARAIWFLIRVSTKLLSIFVIVCKGEMDDRVSINIIFLAYP